MDRKQALKEIKKQKREYNDEEEKSIVHRFVFTIGIVLIALVALYLFVGIFITETISFNKKDKTEEKGEVVIDNTTIFASQLFDQSEEEYYVLIYDPNDKVKNVEQFLDTYNSKEDTLKVYRVDSSIKFNSKYIVESDSNKNPTNYSELRIIAPTLIKISNHNVVEYHEGLEEVKNVFIK